MQGSADPRAPQTRCPFLALCVQQEAASGGKERHKAKAEKRRSSGARMRDRAASSDRPQSAANDAFSAC